MLTGLEILIARMKDHPDEFLVQCKWDTLIEDFGDCFTEEERSALKAARNEMMRDMFNEAVLKRLAGEEDDGKTQPSTATYRTRVRQAFGTTDPRGLLINDPPPWAKQAQANAAAQQQDAYYAAMDARKQAVQRNAAMQQHGLQNSGLGNTRLFGL